MKTQIIYLYIIMATILTANNLDIILEHNTTHTNPLQIILKITNNSNKQVQINPTEFVYKDGVIVKDIFTVIEDGEKIPYRGPIVFIDKKVPNKILKDGESYQGSINLARYYKIKTGTHNYEIYYDTEDSNLSIPLEIEATVSPILKLTRLLKRNATCNESQLSIIHSDQQNAQNMSQHVVNYLPTVSRNHSLYEKWFGYATAGRYNTVYINYKKISSGLLRAVQYDCSSASSYCRIGVTSFVYKSKPYEIYLCNNYWGKNAKYRAYTLVHEMSHFYATAGTVDGNGATNNPYANYTGAQKLAKINPDLAIHNAYSYGYYAKELSRNSPTSNTHVGDSSPRYYAFNNNKNTEGWHFQNLIDPYGGPVSGAWFFKVSYNDPQLYSPKLNINANIIKKITIKMANAFNPAQFNKLQVFWKAKGQEFSEAKSQIISVHNHGGWMTYTIDLSRNYRWRGNIEQIRIDPLLSGDGHWIGIDSIYLH